MKLIILICSLFLLSCVSEEDVVEFTIEVENCTNRNKDTILAIGYRLNNPHINNRKDLIVNGYPVACEICKISVLNIRKLEIK